MAQDINTFKNPENNNHFMIDYPTEVTHKLSDCEQFLAVFTQLVKDKIKYVDAIPLGIKTIHFNDGTSIGGMVPWFQSGAVDRSEWEKVVRHI